MAHSPAWRPEASEPVLTPPSESEVGVGSAPDIAVMTASMAAQGIESSELALDLILHDIAERAGQSTGASGAAIALEREGSMVCRAAAGITAPDLGARINTDSGLTGACVREERAQWCPDTENDDRVDAEACRQLEVRSIAVVPLFNNDRVIGVFEIFSGKPRAFGERELRALQELAIWVTEAVKGGGARPVQRADNALEVSTTNIPKTRSGSTLVPLLPDGLVTTKNDEQATKVLRATVLGLALLLLLLLGFRWGWQRARLARDLSPPPSPSTGASVTEQPVEVSSQALSQRPKPSPAAEHPQSTVIQLQMEGSLRSEGKNAAGKKENAAEREVLTEKRSSGAPAPASSEQAQQQPPQVPAKVEAEPLPASESLARLNTASAMPPLTADIRTDPASLGVPISRGVTPGRLLRRVNPVYPSAALKQHIAGPVVLQAQIGKDGRVHDVKVVSGHPFLATAAIDAVRQWRYEPYKLNGQPVELQTQVTINFNP